MTRGTVCLTFDFDAISLWIGRQLVSPATASRGEFGVYAVPRVLHLLEKEGIESTWFIPGHTAETYPSVCREIVAAGHEIGIHGYAHEPVSTLDPERERAVFHRSYQALTDLVGHPPRGNRTPSWDFSPVTLDILLELGLTYDSSLMATDYEPYYLRAGDSVPDDAPASFGRETSMVEIPVSWSLDDYPHFEYSRVGQAILPGLRGADAVISNWLDDVRYMVRDFENGVAVLTFHPQVIGRGHRMLALERLIEGLRALDVSFSTLESVADRFRQGHRFAIYQPHDSKGEGS
ncbi:MAG TPA: polysaccharide deacetylase [Chloroflexota bacterium]|nr:polysaccharide deacetylase [Chloroflexota bacterium]